MGKYRSMNSYKKKIIQMFVKATSFFLVFPINNIHGSLKNMYYSKFLLL